MDKRKHKKVVYADGVKNASHHVNDPLFYNYTECYDNYFEIEKSKKNVRLDLPIQLGFTILQLAKLHMLRFYYNCLDKYLKRDSFSMLESDTDSAYFCLSENTLEESIRPEMLTKYRKYIYNNCNDSEYIPDGEDIWFVRQCCDKHKNLDKRTPGLMKLEFNGGEKMICLNSKCYVIEKGDTHKLCCKGVNIHLFKDPVEKFCSILTNKNKIENVNIGMRAHNNTIYSYEQQKVALNYIYIKRQVLDDGVSTIPLDITLKPCGRKKDKDIG